MFFILWSGDSGSSFAILQQLTPSLVWRDTLDAKMELLLLNYVALFYVLLVYFAWKRWYYSLCAGGGRKSIKRLGRCAPQVLVRVARQQRQCQLFLQRCIERRHWLHYCFCYYYGGHARHLSSWLLAAGTLYCLWNDVLRWPLPGCYFRHAGLPKAAYSGAQWRLGGCTPPSRTSRNG